ncbi:MAG: ATP-binding protein, partial [Bacteroidota bacterium]
MERLRQERVLNQEQNLFLKALIEASPVGIIILDFDGFITDCNPEALNLPGFGNEEVMGKHLGQIPGPLGIALEQVSVGSSEIIRVSGVHMYKCQKAQFLDRGAKRQFLIVEELTEAILESEKNAYEKVIRMMSHEVNNSTGAINSILHTFEKTLKQQNLPDHLEALEVAITRNEHLGQFMKNFAEVVRLPEPQKTNTDIHKLLIQVYTLYAVEAKRRNIQWQWDLDTEDFIASIDRSQIEQVLVNLVKNAFESMEAHGHLLISTRASERCLIIQDDGPGIPPELQNKLFTPFFSTKTHGQGVGLTLVREILVNHGCSFSLSTPKPGCTQFRIEFEL